LRHLKSLDGQARKATKGQSGELRRETLFKKILDARGIGLAVFQVWKLRKTNMNKLTNDLYKWLLSVNKETAKANCVKIVQKYGKRPWIIRKSLRNSACKSLQKFWECAKYYEREEKITPTWTPPV